MSSIFVKYLRMKRVAIRPICCNPFNINNHPSVSLKDLRSVSNTILDIYPIEPNAKICSKCRLKVRKTEEDTNRDIIDVEFKDADFIDKKDILVCLNKCLIHMNEPVFDVKKLNCREYICNKLNHLKNLLMKKVFMVEEIPIENPEYKILDSIKKKYTQSNSREIKQNLIQLLPTDWSNKQIKCELPNASRYSIRTSKSPRLVKESPNQNRIAVEKSVQQFYCDDEFSRILPGQKDFVSIKVIRYNT